MHYNKQHSYLLVCATLGPVGNLPASGTVASFCMIPIILFLRLTCSFDFYMVCVFSLFIIGFLSINHTLHLFSEVDPSCIVIDECIGCLVALSVVPINLGNIFAGLLIFRFFDITKCLGIRFCEKIHGAWGILVDDIVAGLFTMLFMQIIYVLSMYVF